MQMYNCIVFYYSIVYYKLVSAFENKKEFDL